LDVLESRWAWIELNGVKPVPKLLAILGLWVCCVGVVQGELVRKETEDAVVITDNGVDVLRYQLAPPVGTKLAVESACYFHPVCTPKGVVVTDFAPTDHPHHRGIFLAFVEMHGKRDADFWGWGKYAPIKDRAILNRRVAGVKNVGTTDRDKASATPGFVANNDWVAAGERLLDEQLEVAVKRDGDANVIDLSYTLKAEQDLTLSRWAFGGFCVRVPTEKKPVASGPKGKVDLPLPNHMKPETDWPDARWYDYTFADGSAGVAVINSPKNPPTLWHNQTAIGMLNPCITAPAEVKMKAGVPLVLRYRVVVHDGAVSKEQMEKLSKEFYLTAN
jgi:hypothetical protein